MKILTLLVLVLLTSNASSADNRCPALAGEYIANGCPKADAVFNTTVVHQSECKAVGFQKITYKADKTPSSWSAVTWEPVGLGKLLKGESDKVAYYVERFYDADSLYAYNFEQDKANSEMTYKSAEIIDLLPNGNLYVYYPVSGMSQTMIRYSTCTQ